MIVNPRHGAAIDDDLAAVIDQGAANRSMNDRGRIPINHKVTSDSAEELQPSSWRHCQGARDGAIKPHVSRQFDGSLYDGVQVFQACALAMTRLNNTIRQRGNFWRLP